MSDGSVAAGKFMGVVASNLLAGCVYRFLVPSGSQKIMEQFRALLVVRVGRDLVRRNCSFRRTAQPVSSGIALYRVDMDALAGEEPALLAQMQDYISLIGELGYLIRPNEDSNSDMVMNKEHRERAQSAFDSLWSAATRA
jgi:hypothetical protein